VDGSCPSGGAGVTMARPICDLGFLSSSSSAISVGHFGKIGTGSGGTGIEKGHRELSHLRLARHTDSI